MKTRIKTLAMLTAAALSGTACSDKANAMPEVEPVTEVQPSPGFGIQYTTPVPDSYFRAAKQQGTVELVEYTSKDYASNGQPTHKPAYVYLPYGYDPQQKYDIIYLVHGWGGNAGEYFAGRFPQMKNLFDNLIAEGRCKPFIAVSPTWDKDNAAKGWGESCAEAAVFSQEYKNDLIPAVESKYSTYAETTDEAGIIASREHRAFGGFSLGSITTWYIFEQALEVQKYYLPMSGDNWHVTMFGGASHPEETSAFLREHVNASPYRGDGFYVWYAVGDEDVRLAQTHNQAMAMGKLTDTFNATNFSYHQKKGGHHDFNAVWEFCYHALPFFFPKD